MTPSKHGTAIFKSWIEPIKDQHIVAVSGGDQFRPTASPGGTDSTAFSWIGLNGIGFQQDGLEYGTRTHHSNADTYDRVQKDDVMQSSMIEVVVCLPRSHPRRDAPTHRVERNQELLSHHAKRKRGTLRGCVTPSTTGESHGAAVSPFFVPRRSVFLPGGPRLPFGQPS